jgi:regulator of extracellular matrix RemA (YlzA/DUF370 family)
VARSKSKLINVGFDNVVSAERIVAITAAGPKPMRRLINEARSVNRLVDATNGRKTRSVIITDSNHIVLSSSEPKTLAQRLDEA